MKIHDYKEFFPIIDASNNCLVDGEGSITIGFEMFLPEIYTITNREGLIFDFFKNAFSKLPAGTWIHKQDYFFIDRYISQTDPKSPALMSNERYWHLRPVLNHKSILFITFTNKAFEKIKRSENWILRISNYLSSSSPLKNVEGFNEEVHQYIKEITSTLTSIDYEKYEISINRLDTNELLKTISDYYCFSFDKTSHKDIEKRMSLPSLTIKKDNSGFMVDNKHMACINLVDQAQIIEFLKISDNVSVKSSKEYVPVNGNVSIRTANQFPVAFGLPFNHVVNTYFRIIDKDMLINKRILFERKGFNSFLSGFGYTPAVNLSDALVLFQETLQNNSFIATEFSMNVVVGNTDYDEAALNIRFVQEAFSNMGCVSAYHPEISKETFIASAPGHISCNSDMLLNVLDQSLSMFSFESVSQSASYGHKFIDRASNTPVAVNLFDSLYQKNNRNGVIIGPSGSGKSFWINEFVTVSKEQNHHVIIIDKGQSYNNNVMFHGGRIIDSSDKSSFAINIFKVIADSNGKYIPSDNKLTTVFSVIKMIWFNGNETKLGREGETILKNLIRSYYIHISEKIIFPSMDSFSDFVDVFASNLDQSKKKYFDSVGLKIVLSPFVTAGEYDYLFRSDSELDILQDKFIVFDLTEISKNKFLFPIVSLMVMDLVNQKVMMLPGQRKTLIIDEAWEIFKSSLRDFVEEMYRVVRKYDGRIFLATQNVKDIESSGISDAITINSSISVILDHGGYENMKEPLMKILSLSDSEIDMIFSIKNDHESGRDFFIKQGTKSSVYRLNVSKVCVTAYDSRGVVKEKIAQELKAGKSIIKALESVSESTN